MGQFNDVYYNPYKIVDVLINCGIVGAYVSSTTSCIKWETKREKNIIIKHIKAEIDELLLYSKENNFDSKPLCWIIPQRYYEGETVEAMYSESKYYGFKIHPRAHTWNIKDANIGLLFTEICKKAEENSVPVFIHTGICDFEKPSKFEYWFKAFPNVNFILAHCKEIRETLRLFSKYKNLYGDVSYMMPDDLKLIINSPYNNRLLFGSDFPITTYKKAYKDSELYNNYKQILLMWNK